MLRVISLVPSATEIVYTLGYGKTLVGRSHECDFPSFVKKLPVCAETSFSSGQSSRDIDASVKEKLKAGHPIYKILWDQIALLKPDVIVTQSHCDVCAVSEKDVRNELPAEWGKNVKVVGLRAGRFDDLWTSIQTVADALGDSEKGQSTVQRLKARVDVISRRAQETSHRPTVAAIEWIDPLMAAGNWVPELIEIAGAVNLFGNAGVHSPWLAWEELAKRNPENIVVLPCGFDIDRARNEMEPLTSKPGWFDLHAVKNNQVFLLDGNQYFNRPGPRLVESLEILAEILHPDTFDFGHKLEGWQYWGFNRC